MIMSRTLFLVDINVISLNITELHSFRPQQLSTHLLVENVVQHIRIYTSVFCFDDTKSCSDNALRPYTPRGSMPHMVTFVTRGGFSSWSTIETYGEDI